MSVLSSARFHYFMLLIQFQYNFILSLFLIQFSFVLLIYFIIKLISTILYFFSSYFQDNLFFLLQCIFHSRYLAYFMANFFPSPNGYIFVEWNIFFRMVISFLSCTVSPFLTFSMGVQKVFFDVCLLFFATAK